MTEKLNLKFYAAGVKFRKGWKDNLNELEIDSKLTLLPEPTNKFDKYAVQILSGTTMLGYVPSKTGEAEVVSTALNNEKTLEATIYNLMPEAEPWRALEVEIKEV